MRPRRPKQLSILVALALTIAGVLLSSPASGAPAISQQSSNGALKNLLSPTLIRAEIVTNSGGKVGDYRIDRGVVRKLRGRLLTLGERDGTIVQIRLSSATQISVDDRRSPAWRVRPGMRVTAMQIGDATTLWLYVTRRSPDRSELKIRPLLSIGFVRAEVVSWSAGELLDSRADTGVIESISGTSLTLDESDGTTVELQIDGATQVQVNGVQADAASLAAGMRAVTIGDGDGTVSQIWARGKLSGGKK